MNMLSNYRFLNYYKLILTCYGMYPSQSKLKKISALIVFYILTSSVIISFGAGLSEEWSTYPPFIIANIIIIIYLSSAQILFLMLVSSGDKIQRLFGHFMSSWKNEIDPEEVKILHAFISKGQVVIVMKILIGIPSYLLTVGATGIPPLLKTVSKEEYHKYFPYYCSKLIVDESYRYYQVLLHGAPILIVAATLYLIVSASYIICIYHVCGSYKVISCRLENTVKIFIESKTEINFHDRVNHAIIDLIGIVKKHKEILHEIHLIKDVFNSNILLIQLSLLVTISVALYGMLTEGITYDTISPVALVCALLTYMYFLNWSSELIIRSSNEFFMTTYSIPWYDLPKKVLKLLIIIRERTYQGEAIKIGSVFTLSLENFGWVLQTSWSIATVILSTQNKIN